MTGDENGDIIEEITGEGDLSFQWPEVADKDRENIRRWLEWRRKGGTDESTLYLDWADLVSSAVSVPDGPLSSAQIDDFPEPDNRPTRVLAKFLVFVGAEDAPCMECFESDYEFPEDGSDEIRCCKCASVYTIKELASLAYKYGGMDFSQSQPR